MNLKTKTLASIVLENIGKSRYSKTICWSKATEYETTRKNIVMQSSSKENRDAVP